MKKEKKKDQTSQFITYALSGNGKKDRKTNTTIPTDEGVKEAKDWVDHNKK